MNRTIAALAALVLTAGEAAVGQDKKDADRIGREKPPAILKKALA